MIKASSCVCQTENMGYKSWVTYPRSHILYIEEPRFKPGATGAYAFSTWNKPAKWTSQMADCMAGVGRAGTLSWYSLSRKPASQTKPNLHWWGWEAVGGILVWGEGRIEFGHLQREGHEFIYERGQHARCVCAPVRPVFGAHYVWYS